MLRALDEADRMLAEGRDHVHELRAGDDAGARWCQAMQQEGERLAALHGIAFRQVETGTPRALHAVTAHEMYRIASEAMRNAFQHARASTIEVEVRYLASRVLIDVRDDGQGLPPAVLASGHVEGHWGLPGMRERAANLGAQLTLATRAGGGTHWRLSVPGQRAWASQGNWLRRCGAYLRSRWRGQER